MAPGRHELLSLYDGSLRTTRAHLAVRWATCPFGAVAAAVPAGGPVLELGCGHGLLSSYLALAEPGRKVVGVDVDAARIASVQPVAARVATRGGDVAFGYAAPGHVPAGPWRAVVMVDVLYLVEPGAQEALVAAAAAALAPGGALVVKETDTARRWRAGLTLAQETMAVRVLRLTAGRRPAFVPPPRLAGWMAEAGLVVTQTPLGRGYLHPHHLLVGRRP